MSFLLNNNWMKLFSCRPARASRIFGTAPPHTHTKWSFLKHAGGRPDSSINVDLGTTQNLLKQNLWGRAPRTGIFTSRPGESCIYYIVRSACPMIRLNSLEDRGSLLGQFLHCQPLPMSGERDILTEQPLWEAQAGKKHPSWCVGLQSKTWAESAK